MQRRRSGTRRRSSGKKPNGWSSRVRGLRQRIQVRAGNLHSLERPRSSSRSARMRTTRRAQSSLRHHRRAARPQIAGHARRPGDGDGLAPPAVAFIITTAGYDRHSVCWDERDYAVKLLEGVLEDDAYFAYIATIDVCEACRAKGRTAPMIPARTAIDGRTRRIGRRRIRIIRSRRRPTTCASSPRRRAKSRPPRTRFKRFRLNIWTEKHRAMAPGDAWAACGKPLRPLSPRRGILGLDLSSTTDLSALIGVFPDPDGSFDILRISGCRPITSPNE